MRKAEQHLAEALEALSAERWDTTVLLAIHAAMAAADAVCVASARAFDPSVKLTVTSLASSANSCRAMRAHGVLLHS
jgi:hypothetical protein